MDYKIVFLIIVIIGIVFFLFKEIYSLEKHINEKSQQIIACIETNSRLIRGKIQNDFTSCVSKLRSINGEYMERIRKMNSIESQQIMSMSHGYSDSDSKVDNLNKNIIRHLSDCPEEVLNGQCTLEKFYESEDDNDEIVKAVSNSKYEIKYQSDKKEENEIKKDSIKELSIKRQSSNNSNQSGSIKSEKKNSPSSESSKKPSHRSSDNVSNGRSNDNKIESEKSDDGEDNETNEYKEYENSGSESDESVESDENSDNESSQSSSTEGFKIELEEETQSSKSSKESELGQITFGSKKSGKQKKEFSVELSKKQRGGKAEEDLESINTVDIKTFVLKPIDSYSLNYLKGVAKNFEIPISQNRDGKGRKQLTKLELYDKIKEKVAENDSNDQEE